MRSRISRSSRIGALAAAAAVMLLMTACEPSPNGLTQIRSVDACIAEDTHGGLCRDGQYLDRATSASTPDGKFVYVTESANSVLGVFVRNANGEMAEKACFSANGGGCVDPARAMQNPKGVVATKNAVFVAAHDSDSIAVFRRNPKTGALTQDAGPTGCISETGTDGGTGLCTQGRALDGPVALSISGNSIAVATDNSKGVAVINRDPKTGALTQGTAARGCITQDGTGGACATGRVLEGARKVAFTGKGVYVTSGTLNAVAVITRAADGTLAQDGLVKGCASTDGSDGHAGDCTQVRAMKNPADVALIASAIFVASPADAAVVQIARDPATGTLTQDPLNGCISESGDSDPNAGSNDNLCLDGRALQKPVALAVRGNSLFAGGPIPGNLDPNIDGDIAVINRGPKTGSLSQPPGKAGCITEFGSEGCANGYAINATVALTLAKTGPLFVMSEQVTFNSQSHDGALSAIDSDPNTGAFSEGREGNAGCVSDTGRSTASDASTAGKCIDGTGLVGPDAIAASPDGKNVYAASLGSDAISAFSRNTTTGALTQLPGAGACVSESGAGACPKGRALSNPADVTVSDDGKNVYVASASSNAVAVFTRNTTTGALKQLPGTAGCVAAAAIEGCAVGVALSGPAAVVQTDASVFVASSTSDAIAIFGRDGTTGALSQLADPNGCVSQTGTSGHCVVGRALDGVRDLTLSGLNLYAASPNSQAIAEFVLLMTGGLLQLTSPDACVSETGSAGQCRDGIGLTAPTYVVAAGTANVYARGADDTLVEFARDGTTGALTQLAAPDDRYNENNCAGACTDGTAISGAGAIAMAPDAAGLYTTSPTLDAVSAITRDTSNGKLASGGAGCVTKAGYESCQIGKALDGANAVVVSPDNRFVYVASFSDNAIAVFARSLG